MKQIFTRLSMALVAMIFFGLFFTACGGGDEGEATTASDNANAEVPTAEVAEAPTDEPAPTDTPEPEPTATPEPSPTPEPTPDPTAGFVAFESAEGGFKLQYPDGWFTNDLFGLAIFASAEELLDSPDPGEEGGVMVVITGPTEDFDSDFGSRDPVDVVNSGFGDLGFGEDAELVEGPTATTINGVDAATAVIKATSDNGTALAAYMVVIVDETRAAVAFGATPEESEDEFMPVFATIANTIELMEPVVEDLPAGDNDTAALDSQGFLLFGDVMTSEVIAGESSIWDFIGLEGESVDIVVIPQGMDVVVDVLDEAGNSILESGAIDESFDTEEILGLAIPASGTYYIVITGFSDSDAGAYEISFNEAGTAAAPSGTEGLSATGDMTYGATYQGSFTGEEG